MLNAEVGDEETHMAFNTMGEPSARMTLRGSIRMSGRRTSMFGVRRLMSSVADGYRSKKRKSMVRTAVVLVLAALIGVLVWRVQVSVSRASGFPDQLPNTESDVSFAQALQDHGIVVPASMSDLAYSSSPGDGYPLIARFHLTCSDETRFVAQNQLTEVPATGFQDDEVEAEAETFLGWNPKSTGASWYLRPPGGKSEDTMFEAMIQPDPGYCQVYLMSDK